MQTLLMTAVLCFGFHYVAAMYEPCICEYCTYLNGERVKEPNKDAIYLVLDGRRCHIPNPDTYHKLFLDVKGIVIFNGVENIPEGPALTNGAFLSVNGENGAVYLISNNKKRWVTSPAAFHKYHFDAAKIQTVSKADLDSMPTGNPLK